jgi:hypothetical protein
MFYSNKIQNIDSKRTELKIRRIQAIYGQKSLHLCIPIEFTQDLGISKGDYVKCSVNEKRQLIVEKAFATNEDNNDYSNNAIESSNNVDSNKNKPWSGKQ